MQRSRNYQGLVVPCKTSEVGEWWRGRRHVYPTLPIGRVGAAHITTDSGVGKQRNVRDVQNPGKFQSTHVPIRLSKRPEFDSRSDSGTFPPIVAEFAFPSLSGTCIIRPDLSCHHKRSRLIWPTNEEKQLISPLHKSKSSLARVRSCGWDRRKPSSPLP